MDMHKEDLLPEEEWNNIVVQAKWGTYPYDRVAPLDAFNTRKLLDFRFKAVFKGMEYRGKRGFSRFPQHRFADCEGFKPRIILKFAYEDSPLDIEFQGSRFGLDDVYDHVRKSLLQSVWGKWSGGAGGILSRYISLKAANDPEWSIYSDQKYRTLMADPDELDKAHKAVLAYSSKKKGISEAFRNRVVNRVWNHQDPSLSIDRIVSFGSLVNEFSPFFEERELIELVRFSYKYRNEFKEVTAEDKSSMASIARIRKIHK